MLGITFAAQIVKEFILNILQQVENSMLEIFRN